MIALSGTPSSVFLHRDRRPRCYALEVAKHLGCKTLDDMDKVGLKIKAFIIHLRSLFGCKVTGSFDKQFMHFSIILSMLNLTRG